MRKNVLAALVGSALLTVSATSYAETWVQHQWDVPNKNAAGFFYDADSIKGKDHIISWTEKVTLTPFGIEQYNKHLATFPVCKKAIETKGQVTYDKIDLQMKDGQFRVVGKRNYNKKNELVCTDKEMGTELKHDWMKYGKRSPMTERYYLFVSKYGLGNM